MGRKFFVGGNWKMNGDKASIDVICDFLVKGPTDPNVEVVVSCSPCYLMYVRDKLPADKFGVAAQNCYKAAKGAFIVQTCKSAICSLIAVLGWHTKLVSS